ncbi:MAG: NAD(P)/FAD-dependent oxidoreductase [Polyangiaceae bacterium]
MSSGIFEKGTAGFPHVVIVGAGFGGLTAAQALANADVRVTVVDRRNHHLFQPLLYQVAMAGLSPADIAMPVRGILANQENVRVLLEEVRKIDLEGNRIETESETIDFDFLIVATGAKTDYFGHAAWENMAPGLKSIEDALEIRRRVLMSFELAEREPDEAVRKRLLTFVVIGGGPTGVELAGAIRELALLTLARDFRVVDPSQARVILLEGGDRVLAAMDPSLSQSAVKQLHELGVEVRTSTRVTDIHAEGVNIGDERIEAATVVWAAGVRATRIAESLGVKLDRGGRVIVQKDCSIENHPNVFAIGDVAAFTGKDGKLLPGVSPVAMQQARFVAKSIKNRAKNKPRGEFEYFDKGTMSTIGRSRAVAESKGIKMSGFIAWLAWLFVHLWFLMGFRNRVSVMLTWLWSYITYGRGARLITGRVGDDVRVELGPAAAIPERGAVSSSIEKQEARH